MGTEQEIGNEPEIKLICSNEMNQYFSELKRKAEHCFQLARVARSKGLDPELEPEIKMTEDLAARVEGLVGPVGIAQRIREAASKGVTREMLSLTIAQELVKDMGKKNRAIAVDQAVRTGLAILTEGVLVAPIEGIAKVQIEKNPDGTEFIALYFAGPIRSAGGTGQALSVLIADMVRRAIGLDRYKPTNAELERMKEEMSLYHRRMHLQYEPKAEEIELIVSSCPVCVDGEGTEDEEVSGYRNIPRIKTTKIRGGACLVIAEGLCLKAAKILKIVKQLGIDGWDFIEIIADRIQKRGKEDENTKSTENVKESKIRNDDHELKLSNLKENDNLDVDEGDNEVEYEDDFEDEIDSEGVDDDIEESSAEELEVFEGETIDSSQSSQMESIQTMSDFELKIKPNKKYMRDSLAGRPVFSNPSQKGGFRLRYGRARTTGLAALAINPASMYLLGEFLAIGTQLKIERPGKAGITTSCDQLEGPIVMLKDQTLMQVDDVGTALKVRDQIERIIDIGEILVPFGEFLENNHDLVPAAFDINWWHQELVHSIRSNTDEKSDSLKFEKYIDTSELPTAKDAFLIAKKLNIPLHPAYNLFWHDISIDQIKELRNFIIKNGIFKGDILELPYDERINEILIELCVLHTYNRQQEMIKISHYSIPLLYCLGLDETGSSIVAPDKLMCSNPIEFVSKLSGITIKSRAPTRIGGSMGRPEKAKERMMKPPVHVLFPLGNNGGSQRLVKTAAEKNKILIEAGPRKCQICGASTILTFCNCGGHTNNIQGNLNNRVPDNIFKREIPIKEMLLRAQNNVNEPHVPEIKAVIGLISQHKTPEPLEKGILRAKHEIYVFKDGTIRFDMTDAPLTQFKPKEIGTSFDKLHELGYLYDIKGEALIRDDQIVELKPQDIIPNRSCGEYLLRVSKFLDELLTKFYKMEPFYNASNPDDLLGHIVMGLSPHTSGAVLGRIIGYTRSRVGYAHPFYHAAKRRNCDGDEDCVMLLLDGVLNFSKSYLPGTRGGFMDAPLVFMTYINPNEIDKEAQNIDIANQYPLELYHASERFAKPKELEGVIETVSQRIGTCGQFENFGFMFDTDDINIGPLETAYTRLGSMIEKMEAQLELAKQIRAVDVSMVAAKVIESHFLPDMIGNLRSFSKQSFRCPKCRAKYRRIPLAGVCVRRKPDGQICGNNLTMTVHKGGVRKYLDIARSIAEKYNVPKYTLQRIILNEKAIDSTFENDKVKNFTLDEFV